MKKITLILLLLTITFTSYAQLSEGFDTTALPTGWTVSDGVWESGATGNGNSTVAPRTGDGMALFKVSSRGPSSILSSPSQDLTTLTTPQLTFYYSSVEWAGDIDELNIYYKVSASGEWALLQTYTDAVSDWLKVEIVLPNPSDDYYIGFEGISNYGYGVTLDDVSIAEAPSCLVPTAITLDAVTSTTATISWTQGGTETAWEYVVEAHDSDSDEPTGTAYSTTSNPLTVSGLTANTPYDVYVRADCGAGDFSVWAKISFPTDCDITDEALSHDFDTLDNNDLVVDASCWSVVNQGDANTWGLVQNSTTNNIYWRITYSATAHDDYLYSPAFTVLDGVTDAFNFKGWSYNAGYIESIDLLVVDATDNTVIATLENDLDLPYEADAADATIFTYDLSAYEGQDVKIGFHSSTTNVWTAYLDEFTLDAFSTLGTANNILEGFTLYPTIVKEELNFRSQNKVEAITVFNLLGQKVFSGAPNTNNSSINLSNLRPGVYVVKVSAEGKIGSYKIVKE